MDQFFSGKLAYVQRVCTPYRMPYFERLSSKCHGGVRVFHGNSISIQESGESVLSFSLLKNAQISTSRGGYLLCYQRGIVDQLRQYKPNVIIAEANPRLISNVSIIRWAHRNNVPVIGHGLGTMRLSNSPNWLRHFFLKRYINSFDGIIAYSSRAKREYANLGMPEDRITVACNSHRDPPANNPLRSFPANGSHPSISYVGQLEKQKRIELLFNACHRARSKPGIVIIGDGKERESLQRLSSELGINCQFVGAKRGSDLDRTLELTDLFVMPGLGGLAIHDAMAVGLPVIVGEGDGTQFDVVDHRNGWHFENGNVDTLANLIDHAFESPSELLRMGKESFRRIHEEVNLPKMVSNVIQQANSIFAERKN